jgi:hypothetical protein
MPAANSTFELKLHPGSASGAIQRITASVMRIDARTMSLHFTMFGTVSGVLMPQPAPCERADGLWKTTCFEAFFGEGEGPAYYELNFSPSTQWAAYRFDSYRSGMRDAEDIAPEHVHVAPARADRFELSVWLNTNDAIDPGRLWTGLSAIVEEIGGNRSYWALAHGPGYPDFHQADCFAAEIPPA